MELLPRGRSGYYFECKELEPSVISTCLYVCRPFSYLKWRKIEHIKENKLDIKDISQQDLRELSYV